MGMKAGIEKLKKAVENADFLLIDSYIIIYHLEDIRPYSELSQLVISLMGRGKVRSILSTISITEILTKPFADNDIKKINIFRDFIQSLPGLEIVPPDMEIAIQAASLRIRFRTPDAILIATGLMRGAKGFLTNDMRLKKAESDGFEVILLEDYIG